jgi:hypothetical protein
MAHRSRSATPPEDNRGVAIELLCHMIAETEDRQGPEAGANVQRR